MKVSHILAATMAAGMLVATPVFAQATPAAAKQKTTGEGPSQGCFNTAKGVTKQKTSGEGPSDGGFKTTKGVRKQRTRG